MNTKYHCDKCGMEHEGEPVPESHGHIIKGKMLPCPGKFVHYTFANFFFGSGAEQKDEHTK